MNWLFEDLDARIERQEGRSVAEIFRDSGESSFRKSEHAALRQVIEEMRGGVARVIALGGGAFAQPDNVALLQAAGVPTVFLDAPVKELWRRCCTQANESGAERPLLQSLEQFQKLYKSRRKSYSQALLKINTDHRTVAAIVAEIAKKLRLRAIAIRTEEGEAE